jgi:hypothetical protein
MNGPAILALSEIMKLVNRWEELKIRVDNEMSGVKGAGMTVAFNRVLHIMEELENKND